jgi:phage baseplate assembly protein W
MSDEVALKLPMSVDGNGNLVVSSVQSDIWADRVRIAVGTRIGERVMRPGYGTKSGAALFNTVTSTTEVVKKEINRIFHELFPLLTLKSTTVSFDEPTTTLTVGIIYELPNKDEQTLEVGVVTVTDSNIPYEEFK